MSEYFEIAYAATAKRLCFFTGTGFSKSLSNNTAPGWEELLKQVCDEFIHDENFKTSIFPNDKSAPSLQLDEIAQVIQLELAKTRQSLHTSVAILIKKLSLDRKFPNVTKFFSEENFRIVTTNYDKLAEELAGEDVKSVCPGRPIPRSDSRVKVLHVHGSVDVAERMVLTSNDYFRFMEKDTYYSRKLSTLLHENTVVIIGYSLGDTNLKAILNDYLGFVRDHKVSNSIFFVSRKKVPQEIIDYYYSCYGIRVIEETEVESFFAELNDQLPEAKTRYKRSLRNYEQVFLEKRSFKDERLKKEEAFYEIVASLGASGASLDDEWVVEGFDKIITQKRALTRKIYAWDQYAHLARWLIYLGSLVDVRCKSVEKTFLEAVEFSIGQVRDKQKNGISWEASESWKIGWSKISADNRALIKSHVDKVGIHPEAQAVVDRG
ncbi:SIR2 family NAD-dependent protein deacylase [Celeribacter baekdonensis]|uniref:Uncharacterized protein n=1 Tax=Celeribacter baekdonensis TaxID=875171 RepID=A0A2R4M884_9RHOB|nr:SIR2 family protein [Celeribacter baekdonensis]AVW93252.1 hypothetical protein DA792_20995 [Celeribacter baekdonensis]